MNLVEFCKDSKVQSRTGHSSARREEPHSCARNFLFFFVLLWFSCSACATMMFWATERPFLLFCLYAVDNSLFVVIAVIISWADATEHGSRHAATTLSCTDVGELR